MSLINRVLHDLEDRSALLAATAPSVIGDLRSAQDFARHERQSRSRFAMAAAAVVIGLAIAFLAERGLPLPSFAGFRSGAEKPIAASPATRHARAPAAAPGETPPAPAPGVAAEAPIDRGDAGLALKLDLAAIEPAPIPSAPARDIAPAAAAGAIALTGIEHRSSASESAIQLDFSAAPDYRLYVLREPDRLLIQFPHIDIERGVVENVPADGLVKGIRYAQQDGVTKLIFDLTAPVLIEAANVAQSAPGVYALHIGLAGLGASADRPARTAEAAPKPDTRPVAAAEAAPAADAQPAREAVSADASEDEFRKGLEAYRVGDNAGAAGYFRQVLAANPRHMRARRLLAAILLAAKDGDEAKRVLAEGLRYFPVDSAFAKSYATVLLNDGQIAEALQVLARNWPPIAMDPEYHALAAALFQRQGNHAEAARVYRALVQFNPGKGVWWMGLGISLEALGDRGPALAAYEQAGRDASLSADVVQYLQQRTDALKRAPG